MRIRPLGIAALATAMTLTLAACGSGETTDQTSYHIGVTQIVTHPSLDDIAQGFQDALTEAGLDVEFDLQNAQNDQSIAASIAGTFAAGDYDMIMAITTPSAQAVAQVVTDIPVLFAGVTDPVSAGLVDSWEEPGGNISGTSDMNPVEEQLSLVLDLAPDAKSVGIVYSSAEPNSAQQVQWAKDAAANLGLTIEEATVSNSSEVQQAATSLDVDAYWVPTDNTVVSAIETLIQVTEERQVPLVTADSDSVARGAVATYSFNYYDMGYQTGRMAMRVLLDGEDVATMPVETSEDLVITLNTTAAERMGVTIPQSLLDQADPENILE